MSVSLLELIENGGFKPTTLLEDAQWLLSKQTEIEELISKAQTLVDVQEALETEEAEARYKAAFPDDEDEE